MQRAIYARGLRFLPKLAFITTVALISAAIAIKQRHRSMSTQTRWVSSHLTPWPVATATRDLGMTQIPVLRGTVSAVGRRY